MPYDYPPSGTIQRFGPFEEESHFYGKGVLYSEKGFGHLQGGKVVTTFRCMFEVAYTHDCEIIVICYDDSAIQQSYLRTNWGTFEVDEPNICEKLVGIDLRQELLITIKQLVLIGSRFTIGVGRESYKYYKVNSFEVISRAKNIPSTEPPPPRYQISGLDVRSTSPIDFPVTTDVDHHIKLVPQLKTEDLIYTNQRVADLIFPESFQLAGWTHDNIADFWCALMSVATGRDIQWISRSHPIIRDILQSKLWQRRIIKGDYKGHSYIAEFASDINETRSFIQSAFEFVATSHISYDDVQTYMDNVREYIHYLTLTRSGEGIVRLVSTLTEAILHRWESNSGFKREKKLTKTQRKSLVEAVKKTLGELSDPDLNSAVFVARVENILNNNINIQSFYDLLESFFASYGHDPRKDKLLQKRLKAFVQTRNSVAHDGLFAWHNPKYDKRKLTRFGRKTVDQLSYEYWNALSVIPLILFCLIGYEGAYHDPISDKKLHWKRTKA